VFTGLVESLGVLRSLRAVEGATILTIDAAFAGELELGDSVATNGVCLTVTSRNKRSFSALASTETTTRTTLGALREGQALNLERALLPTSRLGGHIVSGHVDGVGTLAETMKSGAAWQATFTAPTALAPYLVEKGSIAIDGISLTVNGVSPLHSHETRFWVTIIPHTWNHTALQSLRVGGRVNLEVDIIARYMVRLLGTVESSSAMGSMKADKSDPVEAPGSATRAATMTSTWADDLLSSAKRERLGSHPSAAATSARKTPSGARTTRSTKRR
jgi:riboflavin synthase